MMQTAKTILASGILPLAMLLLFVSVSLSSSSENNGPRMEFAYTSFDAGTTTRQRPVEHDFAFVNGGNEALVVHSIQSDCEGSAEVLPSRTIQPGDWGSIHVRYFPAKSRGQSRETFVLDTNMPSNVKTTLEIRARIERDWQFVPSSVSFDGTNEKLPLRKTVRLENLSSQDLHIVRFQTKAGSWLQLDNDDLPPSIKNGEAFEFDVVFNPGPEIRSRYAGTVIVQGDADDSEIHLPVTARFPKVYPFPSLQHEKEGL